MGLNPRRASEILAGFLIALNPKNIHAILILRGIYFCFIQPTFHLQAVYSSSLTLLDREDCRSSKSFKFNYTI
jgi:hypothetical protein